METSIPKSVPLTPGEIASFQALVKPAIVLLLLLRQNCPAGASELTDILGLDEHTVAKYSRILGKLSLVARTRHRGGYRLVSEHNDLLSAELTVNKLQFEPASSTDPINKSQHNEDQLRTAVDQADTTEHKSVRASPDSLAALRSLGIGEPKRSTLARLTYVTPAYTQT